jgi:hypothetical protein
MHEKWRIDRTASHVVLSGPVDMVLALVGQSCRCYVRSPSLPIQEELILQEEIEGFKAYIAAHSTPSHAYMTYEYHGLWW